MIASITFLNKNFTPSEVVFVTPMLKLNNLTQKTDSWQLGHVARRHYVALRLVRGKGVSFCSISQFSNCGRGLCPFPAAVTFRQNGRCPKRQVLHVL